MIGVDLVSLLGGVFVKLPQLRSSPVTIVCESYGGKMGVAMAQEIVSGRADNTVKVNLKGLALGDSWIHPLSFVLAWGNFLQDISLLDASSYEVTPHTRTAFDPDRPSPWGSLSLLASECCRCSRPYPCCVSLQSVMGTALDIQSSVEKSADTPAEQNTSGFLLGRFEPPVTTPTPDCPLLQNNGKRPQTAGPGWKPSSRPSPTTSISTTSCSTMFLTSTLGSASVSSSFAPLLDLGAPGRVLASLMSVCVVTPVARTMEKLPRRKHLVKPPLPDGKA